MQVRIVQGSDLPERFEASGRDGWFVIVHEGTSEEMTYGPYETREAAEEAWMEWEE